ncbi:heterogeneous nuclear ribonucleoprotein 1-like [Diospyros lotus]|uniref:heterogeneous nuclear ribonucleoprotein 1-like n=1 Tax=Diospyros lotus TaxID=55363 RepID=UPI0022572430|nr:heterogeneous nuclear ribonucleoprotein 1-like [Diospyros lotus]
MDSDQGKLFIGGISWETTEEKLKDHFEIYGEVLQTVVMRDKLNGRPRGFGFVVFADPSILDRVLQDQHVIDGRTVEAKRALSREEQQTSSRAGNSNNARNFGGSGNFRTKKIFVGGLPPSLSEDGFRQYFEAYGSVTDVVIMYDQHTQRPRGFGFISFDSEDAVDRVLHKTFHDLNGKQVEVKRALPKDANPGAGGRSMGGGVSGGSGGGGGGYQGYGAAGGNSGSYDGRMDSNRYMQSQNTGGGYPAYGSSGYNAPGYGYAPTNNSMGYGGYGGYGGANSGYGGPAGVAYGNPNMPSAGYGSGPPGAPRSSWSSQAPSAYGAMGYGNAASWGPAGGGGHGSGGPGSASSGQSPGGAAGYGNQGYGYGGYSGADGSYSNQAAYGVGGRAGNVPSNNAPVGGGAGGGELQGSGGGYMGGSYGDANGNSGYGNQGWRSDPSQTPGSYGAQGNGPHGGQAGYGAGYGGATRQAQQQ